MRELNVKEKDLLDRVLKKPELQPFLFRYPLKISR